MNIEKEREAFETVWLVPHELGFFEFKDNQYVLKENFADDFESPIANETYHSLNSGWSMWLKAKTHEAKKLEGCVVVPVEPTDEMKQAAYKQYDTGLSSITDIYKAMVEAARGGND